MSVSMTLPELNISEEDTYFYNNFRVIFKLLTVI